MFGGVYNSVLVAFLVKICRMLYVADGQKPNQITNLRHARHTPPATTNIANAPRKLENVEKVSFAQAIHFNGSFNLLLLLLFLTFFFFALREAGEK